MQSFFSFLLERQSEILFQTWKHLEITLIALIFAIILGVFIGIVMTRTPKIAGGTLGVLGVIQTIPSLALLGFMIPLLGIGAVPAIVALFFYALLPIVRNTYTGIKEVDNAIIEAAKGMGLSSKQILIQVELPLAVPIIFAGIRTAVVINVGVATLCALIAAGGLGEFIFRGIALNNTNMILAGAVPAALLALFLDGVLALMQKYIQLIIKPLLAFLGVFILIWIGISFFPSSQKELKIGMEAEFMERSDGYKGLLKYYDIKSGFKTMELDAGLMYGALKEGKVDVIAGYATDGRIKEYDLVILKDDKFYFPPYYVAPLVRIETLKKYPELQEVFDIIAGKISDETMQDLNYQVDALGKTPSEVATEFLKSQNLPVEKIQEGEVDIIIGGKRFTEQYILLEIFKLLIENQTDLKVELKSGLGGTKIAFEALEAGEIDLYPEYSGTALFVILKSTPEVYESFIRDADKVFEFVRKNLQKKYNLAFLKPLGFNNSYTLMMRKKDSQKYKLKRISDLKKYLEKN